MAFVTKVVLFLALIYAVSCIPIDEPTTKVTVTTQPELSTAPAEHELKKKQDSSEESKESDSRESSEEVKKRPTRHTETSAETAHQIKHEQDNSESSPKIVSGMETSQPQLPARERRNSDHIQTSGSSGALTKGTSS